MTRINLIDPVVMTKKQLIAEYRELPRIPNRIYKYGKPYKNVPPNFRMGSGHESFFGDKLKFLRRRHFQIKEEIYRLKLLKPSAWPSNYPIDLEEVFMKLEWVFPELFNDFTPSKSDIETSLHRLVQKLPTYKYDYFQNEKIEFVEDWERIVRLHHGLEPL